MDFAIAIEDQTGSGYMTFDKSQNGNLMNNIFLSLVVRRGSWFQNPSFGSRLHLLARSKNTEQTAALAEEYCKEALQWIIEAGKATTVDVLSQRDRAQDPHRLKLLITVTKANGDQVVFTTFVEVI